MQITLAEAGSLSFLTQFGVEWQLLVSQGISFALVALALYFFAFKPVIAKADERRTKIEQGLKDAQEARERLAKAEEEAARQLTQAATESAQMLRKARDDAKQTIEKASEEATAKAAEIRMRAEEQLERDKQRIKEELKGELSELVVKAAEAVVSDVITPQQRSKLAEIAAKKIGEQR